MKVVNTATSLKKTGLLRPYSKGNPLRTLEHSDKTEHLLSITIISNTIQYLITFMYLPYWQYKKEGKYLSNHLA